MISRRTIRSGAIGAVVGSALGFVPLVLLVAPVVGGGVAGYLERDGAESGAVAGVLMAALTTVVTGTIAFARLGDLPFASPDVPLEGLALAAALSLLAAIGQIVVAGVGGALGGILEADRRRAADREPVTGEDRPRPWPRVLGSLVAGSVTFGVVAVVLTVVLDPLVWPSLLVSLPVGIIAGLGVAVLANHYLARAAEGRVDWRPVAVGAVAVILVFGLVVGGLSVLGQQRQAATTESTYQYEVTIAADETLENATFYVPVPTEGGSSRLGERFVEDVRYDRYAPAVRGADPDPAPVNFSYELVETERGQMLAITADRIEVSKVYYREVENETMGWYERIPAEEYDPDNPDMGVQNDGSFAFTVTLVADEPIDTADPFDDEPLLAPQADRTEVECVTGDSATHRCFEYEGQMYADYETNEGATVYVSAQLDGRNEWFSGGWTGNEYREWSRIELRGPQSGWVLTDGELEIGSGNYRD
ncbi:DUF5518 domain-containing protein [Halobellus rarus]|uniref:DUF5518 domain-containing protein n=1 Tax=Halobellus rarus TaxID=1126237 RepID=A0ABD6CRC9_9EURY|nr:DUF5518 domain-containing protein [Halobellus rarus]